MVKRWRWDTSVLLHLLFCYQIFASRIPEVERSDLRFCPGNWIPQSQWRNGLCYTHPFSDPTSQPPLVWVTCKLRAGASPSAARCESPAQPKGHLLPDGNPTQRLWPPLITQRQGYGGFRSWGWGGLDDSMDELHTLTLHAQHRKIAAKAQNRVGDKKVHESTFY